MIELSVENLHLTYGDNPVLKGCLLYTSPSPRDCS